MVLRGEWIALIASYFFFATSALVNSRHGNRFSWLMGFGPPFSAAAFSEARLIYVPRHSNS